MSKKHIIGPVLLFLAALVWGASFVAQDVGGIVGSFTFQAVRGFLGAMTLLFVCIGKDAWKKKQGIYVPMTKHSRKMLILGGIGCGLCLCDSYSIQIAQNLS